MVIVKCAIKKCSYFSTRLVRELPIGNTGHFIGLKVIPTQDKKNNKSFVFKLES